MSAPLTAVALHPRARDHVGKRYGLLTVVRFVGRYPDGHLMWLCRCDCGTEKAIPSNSFSRKSQATRSCGCELGRAARNRFVWNRGRSYTTKGSAERVFKQKHAWARAVLRAKGNRCETCGWNRARCDVHHRVPTSMGGLNILSNGVVVCPNCHREEHERLRSAA